LSVGCERPTITQQAVGCGKTTVEINRRECMPRCRPSYLRPLRKEIWVRTDYHSCARLPRYLGEDGLNLGFIGGLENIRPIRRAAASVCAASLSAFGFCGLDRSARSALGINSTSSSSRFSTSSPINSVTPVILPPGRERLVTMPNLTGSSPIEMTIGIVEVAALAASAATAPPAATITATFRRTKSSAMAGSRSYLPLAHANSTRTFVPSVYPACFKPSRNGAEKAARSSGEPLLKK